MFLTAALYKFVRLPDYTDLREPLLAVCEENHIKGTLLLAEEGINGTISGTEAGIRAVLTWLRSDPRLAELEHKESWAAELPFHRMKVRLKKEIVTMGVPGIDPRHIVGSYVKPQDWNALISDPEVVVVDTRNDYEVSIGTFEGAINPGTNSFTELPGWVEKEVAAGRLKKDSKVAMFCTGGIRCEKSTAYMRTQGFENVFHLEGGILKYLEVVDEQASRWQGECFVFDERVSVGHGLKPGKFEFCRACRFPLSAEDKASPHYVLGVSCPHCAESTTPEQKSAYAERQRQMELADKRQQAHIGIRFVPKDKPKKKQA
jgi:UPF0176 protein